MGQKDYKLGQGFQIGVKRFQIGTEITNRGKKDYKLGQGFQIRAEIVNRCRTRSFVSNCNPTGFWISNVSKCNGRVKFNKEFLKVFCDVIFVIFTSSLFHLFIT